MAFEKSRLAFAELTRSLDEATERLVCLTADLEKSLAGEPFCAASPGEILDGKPLESETIGMFRGE